MLLTFAQGSSMKPLLDSRDASVSLAWEPLQMSVPLLQLPKRFGRNWIDREHILLFCLTFLRDGWVPKLSLSTSEVLAHLVLDTFVSSLARSVGEPILQVDHLSIDTSALRFILIKFFISFFVGIGNIIKCCFERGDVLDTMFRIRYILM